MKIKLKMIAVCLIFWPPFVQSGEIPWVTQHYSHFSDSANLSDVLEDLMGSQGTPVVVSKNIDDIISVHFEQVPPREVLDRLTKMYQLVWYYDGHVLFIYNADEVQTATLILNHLTVDEFTEALKELGVYDARFNLKASERDGLIYFSGPERFVSLVMEMAKVIDTTGRPTKGAVVYKWKDASGVTNFSYELPKSVRDSYEMIRM